MKSNAICLFDFVGINIKIYMCIYTPRGFTSAVTSNPCNSVRSHWHHKIPASVDKANNGISNFSCKC